MITATTPKGERRRQALVAAAAELLLEGGFDAVRHRSVATRADLPLASTTYYFESLEDLIARAVEFSGNAELESMRRRIGEVTHRKRGAEATVDLIVDLMVGTDGPDEFARGRLIARYERSVASARHPELREVQLRLRAQLEDLLADVLRRSDRMVRTDQLRRLVAVVDGAVVAALAESDPQPRRTARGALLELIDVIAPPVPQPLMAPQTVPPAAAPHLPAAMPQQPSRHRTLD
ncbi:MULTISPECIES: TetR/AcrR family transcriptional regulator [Nocardia]|uniref:TetR family transcriptional regulator n=2 Tax=Nocardia TaxID=1817 RepID=A0A2T2ZEJ8_9NOCA|nr:MULTISPECIES: TetR family transcriptional regulator [Nocardia]MBF6449705.1 TetR family transcriptional regulator [Nocardia elegans]PSR66192.1 TetR family transcriptional regulator [Nocardia nova]